jgi:PII-like signaling protein
LDTKNNTMLKAQIFINADELKDQQSLQEFIMQFIVRQKIKGATVFRGRLGFGKTQHLQRPNDLFSFDETPVMITFIDESEKVKTVLTELRNVWKGGFIITQQVEEWK